MLLSPHFHVAVGVAPNSQNAHRLIVIPFCLRLAAPCSAMLTYTSTWVRLENFSSHSGRLKQPCMCERSLFAVVMNAVWICIFVWTCMPRDDGTRTILRQLDRKKWDKKQGGHRCDLLCARIHANRRWQLTTCHWRRTHNSNSNTKGGC